MQEESALSLEVEEFVHEKCARHGGPVIHMHVDRLVSISMFSILEVYIKLQ